MAPPTPVTCGVTGCSYNTPMGAEMEQMLEFLRIHVQTAHPTQAAATVQPAKATTKVDKRPRPDISCEMSEHDWRFFLSEWEDYKRATGVSGQHMLDELWTCMTPDIRRLAFDQGGKTSLDTEAKMVKMIKGLAVSVLHEAVHTVELHEARQLSTESTKAFAARVRGIATNCNLSKKCECTKEVTFIEETVYNVVLAGLYDRDMQERAISAAILKTIKDINSLVEFCSAEESGRKSAPSVSAVRSTFQSNKMRGGGNPTSSKCSFCGGPPHSSSTRDARAKECKAFNHSCRSCGKPGHYASVCKGGAGKKVKPEETPVTKNAAVEVKAEGEVAKVEAFAFCSIFTVPTSNVFQPLADLQDEDRQWLREGSNRISQNTRRGGGQVQHPGRFCQLPIPLTLPFTGRQAPAVAPAYQPAPAYSYPAPVYSYPDLPLPGHTIYPPAPMSPALMECGGMIGHKSGSVRIPLCHMEYTMGTDGCWAFRETGPLTSPQLKVKMKLHMDTYQALNLSPPLLLHVGEPRPTTNTGVADSGAQMDISCLAMARSLGVDINSLLPVQARVFGATREAEIDILGAMFVECSHPTEPSLTTVRMFYVASNVTRSYLSLGTLKALGVVEENFPCIPILSEVAASYVGQNTVPSCTNTGVVVPGEKPCSCPTRTLPPAEKLTLPCSPTEENLPILKQYLMDRFSSSSFNICEHQALPLLQNSPPLELHTDPTAKPVAVHRPAVVPLHWKEAVYEGLMRDVRLGVIERVPLNTPVTWQSRMHITAKHDGSPRRTIDYQAVNDVSPRQTHHTHSPWHIVSTIPAGQRKSCFDAFHGYHSLKLASEADQNVTTFITEWGNFRYKTCPQGFLSAGDAYTNRMDRLLQHMERQRRCVDDTLLYDSSIEESFYRAGEFLETCGNNGIILNPKKFKFAESEVDFLGFSITDSGVRPTSEFLSNIMTFPTPTSLTDVRSWYGAVAQVSYSFASSPVMLPFRHLLSSKTPFSWSPDLEAAFIESKKEVVRQCEAGVRSFDPALPTAVATDWCKTGMGVWLTQKRCKCDVVRPGCCPTGWQTIYVGSKFCNGAESRYAPICGEATAAAWGVEKCKFFLLGLDNFILCLDHRPLIKIFSSTTDLGSIPNPRLYSQKEKLLPYRFTPIYIPGKDHVTPDCHSRRTDHPELPPVTEQISLLDIQNVGQGYSSSLGPPSWVSPPCSLLATLSACPFDQPSHGESTAAYMQEQLLAGEGQVSLDALYLEDEAEGREEEEFIAAAVSLRHEQIRAITWPRLQLEVKQSTQCQDLIQLLAGGAPEAREEWPDHLLPYYPYRQHLLTVDGVILCGERPLIPPQLRPELAQHLHAAHQGVTKMLSRAAQSVFWPGMKADLTAHREQCKGCTMRAPSNPAPPPSEPTQPDFPFSHVVADFFSIDAGTFLAMADRYSNWLSIFKLKKDDSYHIIEVLRQYFSRWGVAVNITTDGASVFTSVEVKDFFERWGVEHRVSSAYYPRANKRSEIAVKSAKRLIMDNLGPNGSLNTDKLARAILAHRNCPDPESGLSAAQIIFGRELRDHLPAVISKYQPRQEWRLEADLRARALARRHARMETWLKHGARPLPPLAIGDMVAVQDQSQSNGKPGRWTKSGIVVETLPHEAYMVKIHGSRQLTQRNRRFLRKLTPFTPAVPVTQEEVAMSKVVTRSQTKPTMSSTPVTNPSRPVTPAPPTPAKPTVRCYPAALHRKEPAGKPGDNIVKLLQAKEREGATIIRK